LQTAFSFSTILGKAVRTCRTEAGLTVEEATLTTGVAKQTLSDLEAGKPTVKLGNVLKIANGLGVNLFVVHSRDRESLMRAMPESDQ
jgi:transcriptional regulator with XRE-family HTH domain